MSDLGSIVCFANMFGIRNMAAVGPLGCSQDLPTHEKQEFV